jgi:hypothetical protein
VGTSGGPSGRRPTGIYIFQKDMALHACTGERYIKDFYFQMKGFYAKSNFDILHFY